MPVNLHLTSYQLESNSLPYSSDRAAATLRGIGGDESGPMFADIDSRRCRAHAQMRNFESALEAGPGRKYFKHQAGGIQVKERGSANVL